MLRHGEYIEATDEWFVLFEAGKLGERESFTSLSRTRVEGLGDRDTAPPELPLL